MLRAGLTVLIGACAILACLTSLAGAHRTRASVSIKLAGDRSEVHGRIDSSDRCEAHRTVKLYYAFNGSTAFSKVSSDVSDSSGHWSIAGPDGSEIPSGQLYGKVPKRGNCAKAQSKTLKAKIVPDPEG